MSYRSTKDREIIAKVIATSVKLRSGFIWITRRLHRRPPFVVTRGGNVQVPAATPPSTTQPGSTTGHGRRRSSCATILHDLALGGAAGWRRARQLTKLEQGRVGRRHGLAALRRHERRRCGTGWRRATDDRIRCSRHCAGAASALWLVQGPRKRRPARDTDTALRYALASQALRDALRDAIDAAADRGRYDQPGRHRAR